MRYKIRRRMQEGMPWWTVTDAAGFVAWMFTWDEALEVVRRELMGRAVPGLMWLSPAAVPSPRACANRLVALASASRTAEVLRFPVVAS